MAKTALVTGASRGIGLQLVRELMGAGYEVVATCRSPATATALRELQASPPTAAVAPSGRLLGVVALDVGDAQSVLQALARTRDELGVAALHLLVNNAGVAADRHPDEPVLEARPEDMLRVFDTNVVGPMRVTQAFYPLLLASSASSEQRPTVLNVSSRMGSVSLYQASKDPSSSYRVSKAALNMLTKCFAVEQAGECIHVAMHPGWVQTDMGSSKGRKPPLTPEQSAQGIVRVVQGLTAEDNGSFYSWDGQKLSW